MYALEDSYRDVLAAIARAHGFPALPETSRLGPMLVELSESYNFHDGKDASKLLPARLAFSFPRDVPKADAAVRELVATGALALGAEAPLRLLDVGAGLGAMTLGIARALDRAARGAPLRLDATWIDTDRAAIELGREVIARAPLSSVKLDVTLERGTAMTSPRLSGPFDLIVCGQVMSEMDAALEPVERIARHAAWLVDLSKRLAPAGSLVIVEPALSGRTRHLHAVRDAILASSTLCVFAPCLHREPCPALSVPTDWCHEDLAVDLPEWLVPLAREAGLRWQGLTFSYLVLRNDGRTLRAEADRTLRVTSSLLRTKGKSEAFLCGAHADGIGRRKARLLDREESPSNRGFSSAARGDLLSIDPPLPLGGRVLPTMRVARTPRQ